jgi:hypothetical protein
MHGLHSIKTEKEVHTAVNYSTFNNTGAQRVDEFRKIKEFVFGEKKYFISLFWHLAERFRSSYSNLRQRRDNGC